MSLFTLWGCEAVGVGREGVQPALAHSALPPSSRDTAAASMSAGVVWFSPHFDANRRRAGSGWNKRQTEPALLCHFTVDSSAAPGSAESHLLLQLATAISEHWLGRPSQHTGDRH